MFVSLFLAGAMENWGLVTYRESCLLVDPVNSSANTRNYVALIVAHELSHNWFGNLVTMVSPDRGEDESQREFEVYL